MARLRKDPKGWDPTQFTSNSTMRGRLPECWEYVMSNPASYASDIFTQVNLQLILHPERNTKNIRRADILSDSETNPDPEVNDRDVAWDVPSGMICVRI